MVGLKIDDVKQFTGKLFLGNTFDSFLLREAEIATFNSFSIDGRIRKGYFTQEELEEKPVEDYSSWAVVKPVCFSLIKGKKLPGSFQIVLQAASDSVGEFLADRQLPAAADQIKGLYLNIRYENGKIICVTGTSVSFFTLDKTLETEWDEAVKLFLKQQEITYLLE